MIKNGPLIGLSALSALLFVGCEAPQSDEASKPAAETVTTATDMLEDTLYPSAIPDWARANIKYMSEGTGQWVADNAAYKSETEPWDQYVIEWRAGPDDLSMSARMYALKDGTPSSADFWSFYQFWDVFSGEMRVIQSGWNALGDGTLWWDQEREAYIAEQTFGSPGGTGRLVRHETIELNATEHQTRSLNQDESGNWVPDRQYVWVRSE